MKDDAWLESVRAQLEQRSEAIDGATQSRLTQARAAAVERTRRPRRRALWLVPMGACALLAAVVGTRLTFELPTGPTAAPTPAAAVSDLEILAAEEDFALLADLEFYLWLEAELPATDAG